MEALSALSPDELTARAGTGVRAVFRGNGTGRCIAFRADMDALGITEATGRVDASGHPGIMHACGHDGHMSCLLALARILAEDRGARNDDVVLLFQPDEEGTAGAKRMIEDGALIDPRPEAIYGLHLIPDIQTGTIGCSIGSLMAQTSEINLVIHGRSAHGAMPHLGADAVAAAAHLYTLLQTTVSRRINPFEPALITVGTLHAGERRNVIAANARLECTMRTFSEEVYKALYGFIQDDLRAVEAAFGVRCEMEETICYPCVCNPDGETRRVLEAAGDSAIHVAPRMIAEDFSFYQREIPGVFCFCGCMDDAHAQPLHSDRFDFDEHSLLTGLQLFYNLISWQA